MTSKEQVKSYFPDAYANKNGEWAVWAISLKGYENIMGEGDTEDKAWEDAMRYIESLDEDQKPNRRLTE